MQKFIIRGTPVNWDEIAPPKPQPSEAARRAAQEQFESETDADYLRRLHREQN